ncbi:GNAT family N-acetyltransferase [Halorubellus sp. JP-L1]|uniref:GNAT family N-acetyltransferase n=1 Tax=Halorubellus sp. JP-L1 TaxID=2715753 RepID=UPI001407F1A7|nr:GNAT family protein [Halorubellus sp. JP-L1]NHN43593.1 GNAT family N-acetyltransferase [Halorubellus sp. JP-L1]
MPGPVFLPGDRVSLHTIEEGDLEFLNENVNDPRVRRPLTSADPANMAQSEEFFENVVAGEDSLNLLICVESDEGDPEAVGDIALFDVGDRTRDGEIAITVAPEHWGNGYATEASRLLVEHAFDERNLHRLQTRVLATNDASRRIWEKLGFEHEGRIRENQYDDGEYVDTLYFGLLEREWRERAD